jgi:hypothetical protein
MYLRIDWGIIDDAIVRLPRRFDRRLYLGASLIFFALVFYRPVATVIR